MEPATALREVTVVRKSKKVEPQPVIEVVPEPKRGFLCISRTTKTPHNSLMIGDVEVVVLEVRGQQVKLGISAPKSVSIERKERKKESDGRRETIP